MVHRSDVCYLIGKVLDGDNNGSLSSLMEAVDWALDNGAKVFNLSIDGASYTSSANSLFDEIYNNRGGLVVASAGNSGTSSYTYPASYVSVIAVAAVGETLDIAHFSQRNNRVDISAPGRNILSTVLTRGGDNVVALLSSGGSDAIGGTFAGNSNAPSAVFGVLVDCFGKCTGNGRHICMMDRGDKPTERLARDCQDSGGVAAIVINESADQLLNGKLLSNSPVTIPVVSITLTEGRSFLRQFEGRTVSIERQVGYGFKDGTSSSAPYVTGAIATLWGSCPRCTNRQIEQCVTSTAMNLGSSNSYGHGLLQTEDAYNCLGRTCC